VRVNKGLSGMQPGFLANQLIEMAEADLLPADPGLIATLTRLAAVMQAWLATHPGTTDAAI